MSNRSALLEPKVDADSAVLDRAPLKASQQSCFSRLTPQEWRRRALHMLPGFLPLILWGIYHKDPLSWDCRAYLGLIIVGIGVSTAINYRRIARRGEATNSACILGYTIPVFSLLFLVPSKAELGLTVLAILAMGDGSATLGGMLLRGPRLPWNAGKSWAGLLSFVLVGAPYSAMIYWGEAHNPSVPYATCFGLAFFATTVAAICESWNSKIDDNIRVGVSASLALLLGQTIVGW